MGSVQGLDTIIVKGPLYMAYKYQTFADMLYASYSGLQTLGFASGVCKDRAETRLMQLRPYRMD